MANSVDSSNLSPVYLGFGAVVEPKKAYRLRSQYLPLGKIGGHPSWLNPVALPPSDRMTCQVCGKALAFLLQVYATSAADEEYSFHRTIFFFVCRNGECSRANDASNMRAFRCQLPRENGFYSPQKPMDPEDGDLPDPFARPDYPRLCRVCGCLATKKCARCEAIWYCSREHQAIDWTSSHKQMCLQPQVEIKIEQPRVGSGDASENSHSPMDTTVNEHSAKELNGNGELKPRKEEVAAPQNPFVFREYAIDMDTEWIPRGVRADDSDDDEDDDADSDSDEEREEQRMTDFRQYAREHRQEIDGAFDGNEDAEDSLVKDRSFKKFSKLVSQNPEQVLRYDRGGRALLATDQAPAPNAAVPTCRQCGARRHFEMQLMPHLLSLIAVDSVGRSVDWATVMLFTCSSNCRIPNDAYAEEFLFKQDFC